MQALQGWEIPAATFAVLGSECHYSRSYVKS
jgi:hypothetical protein